jgi:hypothetical protein
MGRRHEPARRQCVLIAMRAATFLLAALLAGCTAERTNELQATNGDFGADTSAPSPPPSDALPSPPPAPPRAPGLAELTGLDPLSSGHVRALGVRACTLSDSGVPLMAAVPGDAIVNDRGRIVHLRPEASDWAQLQAGGRFAGGGLTVEVRPGAVVGRRGATVERDASAGVTRGGRGFSTSHGPRWTCRS